MKRRRCVIGQACAAHGFIHGAEAAELRERLEELMRDTPWMHSFVLTERIQRILDDVDARDSLAWAEARKDREV